MTDREKWLRSIERENADWREARQLYLLKLKTRKPPQSELDKVMQAYEDRIFNPPPLAAHETQMNELEMTYGPEAGSAIRSYDQWLREHYNLIEKK